MSGATRYTTQRNRGLEDMVADLLFSLLLKPPAVAGGLVLAWGYLLHVPTRLLLAASAVVFVVVLVGWVYLKSFSVTARMQRAMVELGLVFRDENGVIHPPQRRGRVRRQGRNLRMTWRLPPGVTLRDVMNRQEAIQHRCVCEMTLAMEGGDLHMEVLRHPIPREVSFAKFYSGPRPCGRLLIGLGVGRRGDLWVDLASLPHLLVGGMTGGGKSVFLSQALTFLCLEYPPEYLQLVCVDLKGGLELARFADLPHARHPVADSIERAAESLGEVRAELDRRLEALRRAGYRDIWEWLDANMPEWPLILVVVDELAELTVRELGSDKVGRAAQQAAIGRLTEIARLARAAGIFLVLATQRPDAEAVHGQLKANLAGTVAFRTRAMVNSMILLDNDRASVLPPHPGRAIWSHDRDEEFQGIRLEGDESRQLLEQRWGAKLLRQPTVPVTPWVQTPQEDASVELDANSEESA